MKYYKQGQLEDEKILDAMLRAMMNYENGALIEARDLLADIVNAIDEFTRQYEE